MKMHSIGKREIECKMNMRDSKRRIGSFFEVLFVFSVIIYCFLLLRATLFKYISPMELFSEDRFFTKSINWMPFGGHTYKHKLIKDIIINFLLFAPFGFLLGMKAKEFSKHAFVLFVPFVTSIALEFLQYVWAVGATDITDIISNTIGAIFGYLIYAFLAKILTNHQKLNRICTVLMFFAASLILTFMTIPFF